MRAAVCSCRRFAAGVAVLCRALVCDAAMSAYRVATGNRILVDLLVRINKLVLSIVNALRSDRPSVDVVPVRARCRCLDVSNSPLRVDWTVSGTWGASQPPFMTSRKTRPDSGGGCLELYAQLGTWRGRVSRGHSQRACHRRRWSPSWLGWPLRGAGSVVSTRRGIQSEMSRARQPGWAARTL